MLGYGLWVMRAEPVHGEDGMMDGWMDGWIFWSAVCVGIVYLYQVTLSHRMEEFQTALYDDGILVPAHYLHSKHRAKNSYTSNESRGKKILL